MKNKTYYIGLDVHKETIAIGYAEEGSRKEATYHGTCGGKQSGLRTRLEISCQEARSKTTGFDPHQHSETTEGIREKIMRVSYYLPNVKLNRAVDNVKQSKTADH